MFTEESIPKFGTEGYGKISFTKNPVPANRIDSMFSSETCFGTEFRVVVSSKEWFRVQASEHFSPLFGRYRDILYTNILYT
jgi:hypothetical protein